MFAVLDKAGVVLAEVALFEDALRQARVHHAARYDRIVRQADGAVLARVMRGDLKKLPADSLPSLASTAPPTARYGRQAPPVPVGFTRRVEAAPLAPPAPARRNASVTPEPPPAAPELTPAPAVPPSPVDQVAAQLGEDGRTVDELVAATGLEREVLKRALLRLWDAGRARAVAGLWSRRGVA